jgi:hypothetical protein
MADQHFAKRQKANPCGELEQVTAQSHWVAFLPIDSADPVMCNLQTLENSRPAMYIQAVRDEPCGHTSDGIPTHRTGFTRAQLSAFVSSFYVQRLMVTKGVELDELVGVFTQQGVAFTRDGLLPNDNTAPSGVCVSRLTNKVSASIREACDVLARGVGYWSRLELCMDASLGSHLRPLPLSIDLQTYAGFDCTATRAWIRFSQKPSDAVKTYSEGTCHSLVKEWPPWLDILIRYLAEVYVENNLRGYTEAVFLRMTEAAQNSPLCSLWWLSRDGPRPFRAQSAATNRVSKFRAFIKNILEDNSHAMATSHQPTLHGFQRNANHKNDDDLHFARACVAFCLKIIKESTDYASLFSGSCADESGSTLEREAFSRALEPMAIKIVTWSEDAEKPRNPIVFPPFFAKNSERKDGPAVLLEFRNR